MVGQETDWIGQDQAVNNGFRGRGGGSATDGRTQHGSQRMTQEGRLGVFMNLQDPFNHKVSLVGRHTINLNQLVRHLRHLDHDQRSRNERQCNNQVDILDKTDANAVDEDKWDWVLRFGRGAVPIGEIAGWAILGGDSSR